MRISTCAALIALLLPAACSVSSRRAGADNLWRKANADFVVGQATQEDVLLALGPPSQLLQLGDRVAFYYLLEESDSQGLFLLVFNTSDTDIVYDRAVFIFDSSGILETKSISHEALPVETPAAAESE